MKDRGISDVLLRGLMLAAILLPGSPVAAATPPSAILNTEAMRKHVDSFNRQDHTHFRQAIPNENAADWMAANVPLFDCPDKDILEIYHFRWWTFRKHIKETADGFVITEFLPKVNWSGKHNTISCPAGHHFREIQLPDDLKGWFKPDYDDSQWSAGRAPIGTGLYQQGAVSFANQSEWGKGEFIVMRTTFEVDALDYDSYRLSILCPQGFHVYLNGQRIVEYGWWQDKPHYAPWPLGPGEVAHLKKGSNSIAVYSNVEYDGTTKAPFGQVDCLIEGLKNADLE